MRTTLAALALTAATLVGVPGAKAQNAAEGLSSMTSLNLEAGDSLLAATGGEISVEQLTGITPGEDAGEDAGEDTAMGMHEQLKTKFVEGSVGFMSLVAIALIIGLTLCIERIIFLGLAETNSRRLLRGIAKSVEQGDIEGAKTLCRNTRGPVASVCHHGLMHASEDMAQVERSIVSYGTVVSGSLERGCSWIRLMIAIAPSLGFLGTVIGMVMAFDQIQEAGDISPTIVAEGMKVALITTIFGIIVALVLQVFYNFILTRIDRLTTKMEEAAITLLDILQQHKLATQQ